MRTSTTLVALVASTFVGFVIPQTTIDPSTVDESTKAQWCTDQKSSCPLLCLQIPGATDKPKENSCSASTLAYSCICSNGLQPNSSQYSQTIPYFECTTAATDCVNKCAPGDSSCQSACRTDNKCGAQNPTRVNVTSSASASGAASQTGSVSSGTAAAGADGASATDTSDANRMARAFGSGFGSIGGSLAVLAGLTGGFMLFL